MTVPNNTQPNPSQYQGVSNPPPDSTITVSTPDDTNNDTVQQTAAANTPPTQAQQPIPQPSIQNTQNNGQPNTGQQTQPSQGKQPDLSKTQNQPNANTNPVPKSQTPPAVQKASIFHDVAETLAGGPHYKYSVDAYGNMQRTKLPVSNAHLALAIAMEALGGGIEGLGVKSGPNATGRAAAETFAQSKQNVQQQDQQARQQATQDFARRAQVLETNMRMYTNARNLSKADADQIDGYIGQYKDLATKLKTEYPGYVEGVAKYSDFPKYHVTINNAIPYMRVARLDPATGKQVEQNGVPQWDIDYLIINPQVKASGLLSKENLQSLNEMGQPFANNEMIGDTPLNLALALNKRSEATQWEVAKNTFGNFFTALDSARQANGGESGLNYIATTAPTLPQNYGDLAEDAAKQNNVDPRLIKGLIEYESSGNPKAISRTGAQGLMQLTKATAQQFGVTNRMDPEQNIKGGTQLFKQLLDKYHDPKLAFAAYYSGPSAISSNGKIVSTDQHSAADTQRYVDGVSNLVGLQSTDANAAAIDKNPHNDLVQWTKNHPTTPSDVEKFMGALSSADGKYTTALQHLIASGQGDTAANISAFLGGPDAIKDHDDYIETQTEVRKAAVAEKKADQIAADKEARDNAMSSITQSYLEMPDQFTFNGDYLQAKPEDLKNQLQSQGVKIPTNFDALWQVAHYKAPASTLPARTWQKGAPNEMDAQTGLSYIQQFINPQYDATKYANAQKVLVEAHSGNSKNGQAIQNAGTAAQHLELLRQAIPLIHNGNIQAINRLANDLGIQIGKSPALTFQAISDKVTQEVEKVAAGGNVPYEQAIADGKKMLSYTNSPQQLEGVIRAYTGLMAGRINPIDYNYYSSRQEHLDNIDPQVTSLFRRYNFETPWSTQQEPKPPVQGAIAGRDSNGNIIAWKLPNGQVQYINQQQPQQMPNAPVNNTMNFIRGGQ